MGVLGLPYWNLLALSLEPGFWKIILILSIFGISIAGSIRQIRDREDKLEGIWYCRELKMQVSLSDPNGSFLTEGGVRIRCRCNAFPVKYYYGMIELYSQEWEHPRYKHGKTLFAGRIEKYSEMSMVVHDLKTNREYTFMRTDKIG